jgi:hypothetical protein
MRHVHWDDVVLTDMFIDAQKPAIDWLTREWSQSR